ncbi:class I SAM-dependent methyltransferase [Metallosphaera tengchongensis]|uniref:Class I SAM-dependent methyltransferase n=1 Tax=Metallosphaera tengchongensis TaxID=1532350 RepID=A0A6N0NVN1_9CREN|nr:class I SAM-dependent methyltransferase [Metallosphaera tengchongensis]QKR00792.1 class I SAM-dependent methyltransferase [Metallosphaera tengchongensis]
MKNDRFIPPFFLDNPLRKVITPPTRVVARFKDLLSPGMTVLDLGSGPGFFTGVLSSLVERGTVWAVDPDPRAVQRLKAKSFQNVIPIVASASNLPFLKDESVDFVFSNLVLCCVVDHEGAMNETYRVMKRGGKAYVSSRRGRGKDPRDVNGEEWKRLISRFKVLRSGESFMEFWAVLEK